MKGLTGAVTSGGGRLPSVDQASTSNIASVVEYCVKNKYLGGGSGGDVPGKLTGLDKASDEGAFKAGSSGMLEKVTEQVYDLVLQHAQSLL